MTKKKSPFVTRHAPVADQVSAPAEIVIAPADVKIAPVADTPPSRKQVDRAAAVAALADLKKAHPRDDAAVRAQKLVVQKIDASSK